MSEVQKLSAGQIRAKIAEVLREWPLYRRFEYKGTSATVEQPRSSGGFPFNGQPTKLSLLPNELQLFCPKCRKEQRWSCAKPEVYHSDSHHHYVERSYACKNCDGATVTYFIDWCQRGEEGSFVKVGQDPPLAILAPKELKLEAEDLDLYKKALTSRNFSFGIGALSYLRRVVENRMNALLDLVVEAARSAGSVTAEQLAQLDEVRRNGRFDEKARYAGAILPNHLKPGGHNPFDTICKFASEGIHAQSEEDCLQTFDEVRLVFEYLFRHLTVQSEDAKLFAESLGHLAGRKPLKP
jgi:hypothetical protein